MSNAILPTVRPIKGREAWRREMQRLGADAPGPGEAGGKRVLIPLLVGASDLFVLREGLIAHALRQRGAEVSFVLCDGLAACDARTFDHDRADQCRSCCATGEEGLKAFGLPAVRAFEFLDPAVVEELRRRADAVPDERIMEARYAGIELGSMVFGSTLRYFRAGRYDASNERMVKQARAYLLSAMLMTEAARRVLTIMRPDRLFTSHGIYTAWGPWTAQARAMNIPSLSYGGGWRRGTLICQHDAPRRLHADDIWPRWRDVPLSAEQEQTLDRYLATRETNEGDFFTYFEKVDRDRSAFLARHGLAGTSWRSTLGLFTNVAFDAAEFQQRGAFRDMFEWIASVVEAAASQPDVLLLIKVHPAESRFFEKTPDDWRVESLLKRRFGALPRNVRLIGPEDGVSPFLLYTMIDAGLVNSSSVGLEMALAGLPVLTTGAGVHYEKPGIVMAPQHRDDYMVALQRLIDGEETFRPDRDLVRRYAYSLYFRKSMPFEPIDVEGWEAVGLRIESLAELAPGRLPGVDALCDAILDRAEAALAG